METVNINADVRDTSTKQSSRKARKQGMIPAVMYGGEHNHHIAITLNEVRPLVYTPDFKLAELHFNGETHRAILKDIQFHPVTDKIVHLDFLKLVDGVQVKVEVPVKFRGTSPGEKAGGKLIQSLRTVKIKTLPENLVDEVYADISDVELGGSIRVRDLLIEDNIEVINSPSIPVATVEVPRALKSATAAEEEEEAEAEV